MAWRPAASIVRIVTCDASATLPLSRPCVHASAEWEGRTLSATATTVPNRLAWKLLCRGRRLLLSISLADPRLSFSIPSEAAAALARPRAAAAAATATAFRRPTDRLGASGAVLSDPVRPFPTQSTARPVLPRTSSPRERYAPWSVAAAVNQLSVKAGGGLAASCTAGRWRPLAATNRDS